jgi:hypothetical protein
MNAREISLLQFKATLSYHLRPAVMLRLFRLFNIGQLLYAFWALLTLSLFKSLGGRRTERKT